MENIEFIEGPYNLPPVYIDGELSMKLNIGAIVKKNKKYYIIEETGLRECIYYGKS